MAGERSGEEGARVPDDIIVSDVTLLDGRNVDIRIAGRGIAELAEARTLSGGRSFAGGGGLCVRPFADPHIHIDKAGTALLSDDAPATIGEAIATMGSVKKEAAANPDAIRDRMVSMLEHLRRAGTRYVRALVDVDETWGLASFRVATSLRETFAEDMVILIEVFPQEGLTPKVEELMRQAVEEGADAIGAHTDIDEDPVAAIRTAANIARDAGLPLQVHVDETASPDSFKMPQVLDIAGDVAHLALAHCLSLATLDEKEQDRWIERIREAGASVVVAPSILCFGLPLAPVAKLLEADVPVLVGSDNLQDVFVPFGTGRLLESARMVALLGGLKSSASIARLIGGITSTAYEFVSGQPAHLEEGSPASVMVFTGQNPRSVLFGDDTIRLVLLNGDVKEGKIS